MASGLFQHSQYRSVIAGKRGDGSLYSQKLRAARAEGLLVTESVAAVIVIAGQTPGRPVTGLFVARDGHPIGRLNLEPDDRGFAPACRPFPCLHQGDADAAPRGMGDDAD